MSKNPLKTFLTVIEWAVLRSALVVTVLSVLIVTFLLLGGYFYQQYQAKQLRALNVGLSELRTKHLRLKDALEVVNSRYLDTYQQLVARKFVLNNKEFSPAVQQNVTEQLTTLISKLELPQIEKAYYHVDEQKPYQVPTLHLEPEYEVYEVPFTFRVGVLHEGEALKLIKTVESQSIAGFLNLQQCSIKRLRDVKLDDIATPNLETTCVLRWYISKLAEGI